ncbi:MAG TPA: alpha/beta hydrolase [Solirubrobacteraceae bacterium]|nr:alpha/beta hydrolase [Solirubrobacteraceae bacterium]
MNEPALERITSADGTSIAIWRCGEGPPLVALHGVTIDHTAWDGVRPELERGRTLLAVDRRGHGASGKGGADHSLTQEVADLLAVLALLDEPADVVAHSYGGLVALEAALTSDRIRRLIVYEPSIDDEPGFPGVVARVAELVSRGEDEQAAVTLLVERSGVPPDAVDSVRELPLWPILLRGVQVLPREGAAVVSYRFDPSRFQQLTTPTLVLVGEESPGWRREAMTRLQATLPQAELRILAGQGHLATHTAPELLAEEIVSFLERQ